MLKHTIQYCAFALISVSSFWGKATVIYDDRASWEIDTTIMQTLDFEGLTTSSEHFSEVTVDDVDFSTIGDYSIFLIGEQDHDHDYLTSGYLEWQFDVTPITLQIVLPSMVNAVGFDFGQFYGVQENFEFEIAGNIYSSSSVLGDYAFFGIKSNTAFNSFSISAPIFPTLDNLAFGNSVDVPEPSSLFLLLGASLLIRGRSRRHD